MAGNDEYALLAECYDSLYAWRLEDVVFYLEESRAGQGPILEAGCGTGRITLPLAELHPGCHAMDLSPAMLAVLERKLRARPDLGVHLHCGDFRTFHLDTPFRQILMPFRGLLHLPDQESQLQALRNLRRHLAPEGRLVLDVFAPSYKILSSDGPGSFDLPEVAWGDGRILRCSDTLQFDHARQYIHVERRMRLVSTQGETEERVTAMTLRYVFRFEMELLLKAAGFQVEEVYGGFDRRPYDYHSGEMIFMARAS